MTFRTFDLDSQHLYSVPHVTPQRAGRGGSRLTWVRAVGAGVRHVLGQGQALDRLAVVQQPLADLAVSSCKDTGDLSWGTSDAGLDLGVSSGGQPPSPRGQALPRGRCLQ